MSDLQNLVKQLEQQTRPIPTGARERVWSKLDEPGLKARSHRGMAFAAALALGFIAVFGVLALRKSGAPAVVPERSQTFATDGFAIVTKPGAQVTADGAGRFTLVQGGLAASAWSQKITLRAGKKTIEAEAARFTLEVAGESVVVGVQEGAVLVDGERVEAPNRWPHGASATVDDQLVKPQEPAAAADDRAYRLAEEAASKGDVDHALEKFRTVSRHDGLRAEAALLRQGQLLLWNRHDPSAALEVLNQSERRFPHGSLAQDAALSRLEALSALKQPGLHDAAAQFLERFPDSERRDEVCRLGQLKSCER